MRTMPSQHSNEHCDTLYAMREYGGSFVSYLADAWMCADGQNHEKLWNTFSHYWEEYYENFVKKTS